MRSLKPLLLIIVILAAVGGLAWNWRQGTLYPATDDAYLATDVLQVTPQVGGRVQTVAVAENDHVAAGQTLFTLDTARLATVRDAAQAQLDLARNGAGASGADVAAAQARVVSAQAAASDAQATYDRQKALYDLRDVSQAALDAAASARDQAQAAVAAAEAALRAAQTQSRGGSEDAPAVRSARASLEMANLDLAHATVTAPAAGWVAGMDLRPGQVLSANVPQFSLVEETGWWVDANFKETDLHRIRPGQPATVEIDMYPGLKLSGHVVSIGAGSGASFSLLPAQNATGTWVKVTQRFAVRIGLDDAPADPAMQLRLGASARVTVDTTAPATNAAK